MKSLLTGWACSMGCLLVLAAQHAAAADYPRENIYDTSVHSDEALVNVSVAVNRWPDCSTLESAMADIFRLEGVRDKSDQEKALALWKWFRILVSPTGGHYAYEGPPGKERICVDPHRIFTVYGHHQCDGQSWAMVPLWRAAGYMALDECNLGHTTAALRYRDADGQMRYHSFDPQHRVFHWDEANQRVGTRSMPVMHGMVYRHLTAPQQIHSLRTSLRLGESLQRKWDNEGHIVPSGPDKIAAEKQSYYAYAPGKTKGIYASVGEEVQTLVAETRPETFKRSLFEGSANVACSAPETGRATLHPSKAGQTAALVYRLAPPYVVADARCEAQILTTAPGDTCRVLVSRDAVQWTPIYTKQRVGEERVVLDFGKDAWKQGRPNVYTAYDVFLKVELKAAGDVRSVGVNELKMTALRMLNKRTLPNLRPGENVVRVSADRIAPGYGLELAIKYFLDGVPHEETRLITQFPCYFPIDVPNVPEDVPEDYDQRFNEGRLRMVVLSLRLQPIGDAGAQVVGQPSRLRDPGRRDARTTNSAEGASGSLSAAAHKGGQAAHGTQRSSGNTALNQKPALPASEAQAKFALASPHPANLDRREKMPRSERDVRETSGFFPQSDARRESDAVMQALLKDLNGSDIERRWVAAEGLGAYPEALDTLLARLPAADGDLTLFLVKALAQLKDRRAVGPLLEKWKRAPNGAPGTRYIPDALAAIGDRSVVPQLIAPLTKCRFDYRFHVAHALGLLGGPEAEKALEDLAAHDPFPAVREEAAEGLRKLRR